MKENEHEITMKERGNRYGNYLDTIKARTDIIEILKIHHFNSNGENEIPNESLVMLGDIVMKLVRASASPKYIDNYHDIACYATLIEKEFANEEN